MPNHLFHIAPIRERTSRFFRARTQLSQKTGPARRAEHDRSAPVQGLVPTSRLRAPDTPTTIRGYDRKEALKESLVQPAKFLPWTRLVFASARRIERFAIGIRANDPRAVAVITQHEAISMPSKIQRAMPSPPKQATAEYQRNLSIGSIRSSSSSSSALDGDSFCPSRYPSSLPTCT